MTAQGTEARRGETAGLDAKRDGPVGTAEAPNPLFQEGYSMTDTTDQQAVTVTQIEAARRYIRGEDDAIAWAIQAAIDASPDRLASVSSASAELSVWAKQAPTHIWLHGIGDPIGETTWATDPSPSGDAEEEAHAVAYVRADLAASPEPVPATNQAGEVGFVANIHERTPNGEWIEVQHHPNGDWSVASDVAKRDAASIRKMAIEVAAGFVSADYPCEREIQIAEAGILAALATQPATSQEARDKLQQTWDLMSSLPPLIFSESEADHLIATMALYAVTPTPPTLSEDLREGVVAWLYERKGCDPIVEKDAHRWASANGWTEAPLCRAALATQPATSQEGDKVTAGYLYAQALFEHEMKCRGVMASWSDVDEDDRKGWQASADAVLAATPTPPTLSEDLREALEKISRLRPAGDVETCKSPRKLVEQMETIALSVLAGQPARSQKPNPYIAGPIWAESEDDCFTGEVQIVGGHAVVATVHGATRDEAEVRQSAVIAALARAQEQAS